MQIFDEWLPLKAVTDVSEANVITTDTRQFPLYTKLRRERFNCEDMRNEMKENRYYERYRTVVEIMEGITECDDKFLIDENEVIPFLKKILVIKYESKELMLRFDVDKCDFWLKYIRIFRVPDSTKFVVTNEGQPIEWRKLDEKNLIRFL